MFSDVAKVSLKAGKGGKETHPVRSAFPDGRGTKGAHRAARRAGAELRGDIPDPGPAAGHGQKRAQPGEGKA